MLLLKNLSVKSADMYGDFFAGESSCDGRVVLRNLFEALNKVLKQFVILIVICRAT